MLNKVTLTPGSIVFWKDYSKLRRWWAKFRKKELPYNRMKMETYKQPMCFFYSDESEVRCFTLNKPYSNEESVWSAVLNIRQFDINSIANIVRPGTFPYTDNFTIDCLEKSKYYKEVHATKESN